MMNTEKQLCSGIWDLQGGLGEEGPSRVEWSLGGKETAWTLHCLSAALRTDIQTVPNTCGQTEIALKCYATNI